MNAPLFGAAGLVGQGVLRECLLDTAGPRRRVRLRAVRPQRRSRPKALLEKATSTAPWKGTPPR